MRFFTALFLLAFSLGVHAQSIERTVIGAAGDLLAAEGGGSLHFTLGELAVKRSPGKVNLSRGFHQSAATLVHQRGWRAPEAVSIELLAYPNPTDDLLTLSGDWQPHDRVVVNNLLGRRLIDRELEAGQDTLSLGHLPPGTYLLSVRRDGQPLRTLRIVRH